MRIWAPEIITQIRLLLNLPLTIISFALINTPVKQCSFAIIRDSGDSVTASEAVGE